jgi:hypothetical protein
MAGCYYSFRITRKFCAKKGAVEIFRVFQQPQNQNIGVHIAGNYQEYQIIRQINVRIAGEYPHKRKNGHGKAKPTKSSVSKNRWG